MNVSKNAPVAPSAKYHVDDGAVTPAAAPPPLHGRVAVVPKYIARSATTGCVASTMMPNARLARSGMLAGRDRRARERRDLHGRRHRRVAFAQERQRDVDRRGLRIRDQHERVEVALRAFREDTTASPAADTALSVWPPYDRGVPELRAFDRERQAAVGRDLHRRRRRPRAPAASSTRNRHARPRRNRARLGDGRRRLPGRTSR